MTIAHMNGEIIVEGPRNLGMAKITDKRVNDAFDHIEDMNRHLAMLANPYESILEYNVVNIELHVLASRLTRSWTEAMKSQAWAIATAA